MAIMQNTSEHLVSCVYAKAMSVSESDGFYACLRKMQHGFRSEMRSHLNVD